MNYSLLDFCTLIGSLGLFLYGMKLMSEALQKVAGDRMRAILSAMTKNRLTGVLTGILITALIQSSSATTVMVVSFVNAGLLTLVQSITVIMGANIGTTVTAWIISLLGFKVSISSIAVPLIALAIPFVFSSNNKRRYMGEFIIGFALLFMGLDGLKTNAPDLNANPSMLAFVQNYTDMGFLSVLLFLFIGALLTVIVQASAATMAITLIMCANGWIPFELAAAMVLGENIGTTITANLAAIPANVSAKRAAFSHLIFNIFGVIWMLVLFYPFTHMVSFLVERMGVGDPRDLIEFARSIPEETMQLIINNSSELTAEQAGLHEQYLNYQVSTSYALSLFHTLFNVTNTFVMIWFVKPIANIVSFIIKKKETDEEFQLKYISTGMLSTSELSILQVRKELGVYSDRMQRMFGMVRDLCKEENDNEFVKIYTRIEKYESISDRMEIEIADYLAKVAEGRLSSDSKHKTQTMLRIVSEIESVGDACFNLARILQRKRNDKSVYTPYMNDNVELMFNLIEGAIFQMTKTLNSDEELDIETFNRSLNIENEINNFRNQLKNQNAVNVNNHDYDYLASVTYMDTIVECEKMGDYVINVMEALRESEK
ncbi:MAG: Na/Pi cotransporter family protein [Paludibacteraceae bacterium]|nr:Na/Pi cotransporter family protein [Paludibacteraceae bacterium]MBO7234681.1 Na/Pi cotransporter family protein [Paludibacteraceae bacterium]